MMDAAMFVSGSKLWLAISRRIEAGFQGGQVDTSLWTSPDPTSWLAALERYEAVIAAQGVRRLAELDRWYRLELPPILAAREPAYLTRDELIRVTEWKMARGVWRQRNLILHI